MLGGGGTSWAEYGALNSGTHDPLSASSNAASSLPDATNPSRASHKSNTRSLYALSEVFTVGPNPAVIERLAITSEPNSEGIYRPGEAIEVTATFGAPVEVQGEPRIQLHLGQSEASQVWADYVSGGALTLNFRERILVRNNQVSIPLRIDELNSTTTKAAQAFTTGPFSDGYRLESIGATLLFDDDATAGQHLTATLNAQHENGGPGAALCTLTDPTRSAETGGVGTYIFAAPTANPCPALAANTTYFLVIERNIVTTDKIHWNVLGGGHAEFQYENEIVQGEPGWSIPSTPYTFAGSWSTAPLFANLPLPYGIQVAGAEAPPPALVGNTGRSFDTGQGFSRTSPKLAQGFTTGDHAHGYVLGSIGVAFNNIFDTSTAGDVLTTTLHEAANAVPGRELCTLEDPASFVRAAVNTFDAPPTCPTLTPNTTYFVVVTREEFVATELISLQATSSTAEDMGGTTGWSISNEGHHFTTTETDSSWSDTLIHQIEVNGVAAEAGYSPDQLVFSYTVRAGDESDSDGVQIGVSGAANAIAQDLGGSITLAGTELDALLDFGPTDSFRRHRVNWERPSLVDAVSSTDGRRLHLTFSEALNPRTAPSNSYFTVMLDSEPAPLRGTTAAVAARTVTLTLLTPIDSARHVLTVAYRDSPGDDADAVEDLEGNDANGFRARVVPNRFGTKAELLPDSPLVPEGLEVGDRFRLLFLTSTKRDAISPDIETYNAFVQAAAGMGRRDIRAYRTGFLAVASTAAVDARDNTATTYTNSDPGVPIYWLRGGKIAEDYDDFYDGEWENEAKPTDESGEAIKIDGVWTGSAADGTKGVHDTHGATVLGGGNRSHAAYGRLNSATIGPLSGNTGWREIERPLYALSEVFTVVSPAAIETVEIVSDPGSDGNYATGDEIAVAFTFGDEVDVSGNPSITIRLGEDASTERTAYFDGDVLVKNTAQAPFSGSPLNAATPRFAQRFTTGNIPGGYRLSGIGVRFHTIEDPASAGGQLTVTVNRDNSGEPGAVHCTLTTPARLRSNELSRFAASGCTLSVETDYYVVIERTTVSGDTIAVWTTASDDEDAARLEDWSIHDRGHIYRSGSWSPVGAPFMIKVGGELSDTDIYQPKVLLSNTGQTLQAGLALSDRQPKAAISFKTGANRLGYRLHSIGLPMGAITDTATVGDSLRVTLNSSQEGIPTNVVLCTLSHPESFSENAVNRFGASTCPPLPRSTFYSIVVERLSFDGAFTINPVTSTSSFAVDTKVGFWRFVTGSLLFAPPHLPLLDYGWNNTDEGNYRMEVNGRALLQADQPEPPAAIGQPRKQVANTGQTGLTGSALTNMQPKHAQAFTTGANDRGYDATQVDIRFSAIGNVDLSSDQVTASLHAASGGDPGDLLCNLVSRGNVLANRTTTFLSLALCPTLEPNTTYFLVVERHTVDADTIEVSVTASDAEDAARAGWSIADDSRVYDGTAWSSGGGSSLAIDVRAVDIPSEEDLRPTSTVEQLVAGPVGKLVSNNLEPQLTTSILETDLGQIANAFTTGANADGYRLSSLGWLVYNAPLTSLNNGVNVSLKTSNGRNPDETLCTLGDAQAFTIGGEPMIRFYPSSATACPALEPNTTYFGVMEDVPGDTIMPWVSLTDTGAEDNDSAPGWSIGDRTYQVVAGATQWTTSSGDAAAWAFEVRGAELAPPPSVKNLDQPLASLQVLEDPGAKLGQAFTTGANERGYELSSIGLDIHNWKDASHLAVTLNADNNGLPGEALCTLNDPASLSQPQTLDAPITCPTLTSNTTYFAVADLLVAQDPRTAITISYTASGAEDSDSAPDWSIAGFRDRLWRCELVKIRPWHFPHQCQGGPGPGVAADALDAGRLQLHGRAPGRIGTGRHCGRRSGLGGQHDCAGRRRDHDPSQRRDLAARLPGAVRGRRAPGQLGASDAGLGGDVEGRPAGASDVQRGPGPQRPAADLAVHAQGRRPDGGADRPRDRRGRGRERRVDRGRAAGGAAELGLHALRTEPRRPVPTAVPDLDDARRDLLGDRRLQQLRADGGRVRRRRHPGLQPRLLRGRLDGRRRRPRPTPGRPTPRATRACRSTGWAGTSWPTTMRTSTTGSGPRTRRRIPPTSPARSIRICPAHRPSGPGAVMTEPLGTVLVFSRTPRC